MHGNWAGAMNPYICMYNFEVCEASRHMIMQMVVHIYINDDGRMDDREKNVWCMRER